MTNWQRGWRLIAAGAGLACVFAWRLSLNVGAANQIWNAGDVFAAVGNGTYKVYDNNGVFKDTLVDGLGGFTSGCAFNPQLNKLYTTNFSNNHVVVYQDDGSVNHPILADFATDPTAAGNQSNESIVFNTGGDYFVSHADGAHQMLHYSAADAFINAFNPAIEARGDDWNDLNGTTMYYTSEGHLVKTFDISTATQGPDFASGLTGPVFALRRLPNPTSLGGVLLVANTADIKLLNAAGVVVASYDQPGEDAWFALNLDPDGTSFWSGDSHTGNFYRFNIETGVKEVGPINTGAPDLFFGLCIKGELTAPTGPGFVIGDVEPHALSDTVNFWGAQWWKNNSMSAGFTPGTASFKGFATDSDNVCGGTWKTRPGNSPPPPATIPDDITIIVTDRVAKSGPNITGTIVGFVTVHSDGNYSNDPGHRGGGVVTSVTVCPPIHTGLRTGQN